jgi:hypothetical protein
MCVFVSSSSSNPRCGERVDVQQLLSLHVILCSLMFATAAIEFTSHPFAPVLMEADDKVVLAARAVEGLESVGCSYLIQPSPAVQRRAVVLLALTSNPELVLQWVRLQQLRQWKRRPGLAVDCDCDTLRRWASYWDGDVEVKELLSQPLAPARQQLQLFAAEFETHLLVDRLHGRGLRVPPAHVVATYLVAVAKAPQSQKTIEHVNRLRDKSTTAKKWGRAFRQRWGYEWGMGHLTHGVTPAETDMRVAVFLRWVRWTLEQLSRCANPIVVNMDETMLSSVRPRKLGVVPNVSKCRVMSAGSVSREVALPRTSLIAAVCSDASLQQHLPQMRLPRSPPGAIAGRRLQAAYATAGLPQCTLHGSSGWNTSDSFRLWLRELVKRLRRVAPGRPVVLVVDDCAVHVSDAVLKQCCDLRVALVVIPSRMTWLLQPLDTHVFACLKTHIRRLFFTGAVESEGCKLSPTTRIRLQGDAIRSVLVNRDWSVVMQRAGLSGPNYALRDAVAGRVRGVDLAPRGPTAEELRDVLQVPLCRAVRLQQLLRDTVDASRNTPAGAAVAAAGTDEVGSLPAHVRASAVPRLRLGGSARLPRAPAGCPPAATYLLDRPRRSPVVTRSRSAACLETLAAGAPARKRSRTTVRGSATGSGH